MVNIEALNPIFDEPVRLVEVARGLWKMQPAEQSSGGVVVRSEPAKANDGRLESSVPDKCGE